ncbi:MAG: HAMP domain-containing protein [Deltaproteobacteria bacterium]|nr:HAMP domain-containing protein [Deltaproteobacteria bacterium]
MKCKTSFRTAIFLTFSLVVFFCLLIEGYLAKITLRENLIIKTRDTLYKQLDFLSEPVKGGWTLGNPPADLESILDQLGKKLGLNIVLAAMDGFVTADVGAFSSPETRPFTLHSAPDVASALEAGQGWTVFDDLNGNEVISATQIIRNYERPPIILRLSQPLFSEKGLTGLYGHPGWSFLGILLICLILVYLLSKWLTRPLAFLIQPILNATVGDAGQRMRHYPNNEIGDLGRAFDRMADNFQQKIDEALKAGKRLETVLKGMLDGVLVINGAGRISLANHGRQRRDRH